MLTAIVNHEYQHSMWIGEVRRDQFGYPVPEPPTSDLLVQIEGYTLLG